jgi:hypothetical protein
VPHAANDFRGLAGGHPIPDARSCPSPKATLFMASLGTARAASVARSPIAKRGVAFMTADARLRQVERQSGVASRRPAEAVSGCQGAGLRGTYVTLGTGPEGLPTGRRLSHCHEREGVGHAEATGWIVPGRTAK